MAQQHAKTAVARETDGAAFHRVTEQSLLRLARVILEAQGLGAEDAKLGAEILVTADLMGIDSHGVAHLGSHLGYVPGFKKGVVEPAAKTQILYETPATARLDGDRGFGPLIGHRGMTLAIEKARSAGVGMVVVDRGRHFGAAGYYALMAARQDMIGIAMCNAKPQVYPANGRQPMLGTNPIAVAVPVDSGDPFLLDMATSVVAMGKLEIAEREGRTIPAGWGADRQGSGSVDPHLVHSSGGLLPLGSSAETSSYKGQGLGMVVDILTGVLSGAGFGLRLERDSSAAGFFFVAVRVDAFRPLSEFKRMMAEMLDEFRACPSVDGAGPVMVPGQREFEEWRRRSAEGIPLHQSVYDGLLALKQEFGLAAELDEIGTK